jgi:hypothetical protein
VAMAGVLVGLGFAVKVTAALTGAGLAIALVLILGRHWRRLVPRLAALGAGFAVTAGAAVAIGGSAMLRQSSQASDMVSIGSPWRVIRTIVHFAVAGTAATDIVKFGAIVLAVALAGLLIRGLSAGASGTAAFGGLSAGASGTAAFDGLSAAAGGPAAFDGLSAAAGGTAAFALALAWLFAWPYVLPWYDALAWALLPLVPLVPVVETLGWLLLARTAALGFGYLPARQTDAALPPGLGWLQPVVRHGITPAVLAVATVWLVSLMLRARPSAPDQPVRGDPPPEASQAPAREASR